MNIDLRDYAESNLTNIVVKNEEQLYNLAEDVMNHLGLEEDVEEVAEILKGYVDLSIWEDEDYEEEYQEDKDEDDDNETWIDPAGGTHYGNKADPAAQYESIRNKGKKINENVRANDESQMAKIQLKSILDNTNQLLSRIDDCKELDAWVQSYLTKADDYLESVRKYVTYGAPETTILEPIPVTNNSEYPIPSAPQPSPINPPVMPPMDITNSPDDMESPEYNDLPDDGDEDGDDDMPDDEFPDEFPDEFEMDLPSKKEEDDELTFDDIDFYNKEEYQEDKDDQEEILSDFNDISDDDEENEEEEEENELEESLQAGQDSQAADEPAEIFIDNEPWYIKKIDESHFFMTNDLEEIKDWSAWPYDIKEHRGRPYYNDIREWLHDGPSPDGKNYSNN